MRIIRFKPPKSIDLQHFSTVHRINVRLEAKTTEPAEAVQDWLVEGELPESSGLRTRIARWFFGNRLSDSPRILLVEPVAYQGAVMYTVAAMPFCGNSGALRNVKTIFIPFL